MEYEIFHMSWQTC